MPENLSFLSPTGFKFSIQKLPHVNYFCTSATIPDITLGQVDQENIFIKIPVPGDKLTFSALELRFAIDEDLKNFKEIYDWLEGLGYPDNFQQRANLQSALQQNNGNLIWEKELGNRENSYSASPGGIALDNNAIYAHLGGFDTFSFDLVSGEQIWKSSRSHRHWTEH